MGNSFSSTRASELEFQELRLRWTADTREKPGPQQPTLSSAIRFQGGEWHLGYFYREALYTLVLETKALDDPFAAFVVSVHLESAATGRIAPELSQKERCTKGNRYTLRNGRVHYWFIWLGSVLDIERSDPGFGRDGHLRFHVVIRDENATMIDVKCNTTQNEVIRDSRPTASTFAQIECLPRKSVAESSGTDSTSVQTTLFRNTPDCPESLSQDLSKLLDQESDTDVEFQCGGQSTRAHGSVVCVRSEVIASMLASDMVEGRTKVIKIPNMEPDVFRHFLRYIYTGSLPELTVDLALNLYENGDQYAVLGLARRCSQYLMEHLSVENACDVLVVLDAHSNAELKEAVTDFMLVNSVPRVSDRWKDFCNSHPMLAIEVLN